MVVFHQTRHFFPVVFSFLFLFSLDTLVGGIPYDQQTITSFPPEYPSIAAQETLSLLSRVPNAFQIAVEQTLGGTRAYSSDWTDPKGQELYSLVDLLWGGVRSFQLDVHYIVELAINPIQPDPSAFRVCKSVGTLVDVPSLCEGSRHDEICLNQRVEPTFGPHAGCPPNSPMLQSVLSTFLDWIEVNPNAALTIRIADFATGEFSVMLDDAEIKKEIDNIITETIGPLVFAPVSDVDYSVTHNWPRVIEILEAEKNFLLFSNISTDFQHPYFFDADFLQSNQDVGQPPFFPYSFDTSDRVVVDGVEVYESGSSITPSDVPSLISDLQIPSVQRLENYEDFLWGFSEQLGTTRASDASKCVVIDPSRNFGWYHSDCGQNFYVACTDDSLNPVFSFGKVTDNSYETSATHTSCPGGRMHTTPSNPYQYQQFKVEAEKLSLDQPIYVNLRFDATDGFCDCGAGCWYLPDSSNPTTPTSPVAFYCVSPQFVQLGDIDTNTTDTDDDDDFEFIPPILERNNDDLTDGEKAAIIIACISPLLVAIVVGFVRAKSKGGHPGRVGGANPDDEDDGPSYKEGRDKLEAANTETKTTKEYPDGQMDLEKEVEMELESEKEEKSGKRKKIGPLDTGSGSMRDYRSALDDKPAPQ